MTQSFDCKCGVETKEQIMKKSAIITLFDEHPRPWRTDEYPRPWRADDRDCSTDDSVPSIVDRDGNVVVNGDGFWHLEWSAEVGELIVAAVNKY